MRSGFNAPCLPTKAKNPPSGDAWLHEIKHDGFRLIARRDATGIRLLTRKRPRLGRPLPLCLGMMASSLHLDASAPDRADLSRHTSSEHDVIAVQQRVEREHLTLQGNRAISPADLGIGVDGGDGEQTARM
jgi:hypothetical protein